MNKYVVAYASDSDDGISQALVEGTSKRDAVLKYLAQFQDLVFEEDELLANEDVSSIIEYCNDYMAASVAVIEV